MTEIKASMAGDIWKIMFDEGGRVTSGEDVVILESMKMEIPLTAEQDGTVKAIKINEGDFINEGDVVAIRFQPSEKDKNPNGEFRGVSIE